MLYVMLKNKMFLKLDQNKENKNVSFKKYWNGMLDNPESTLPSPFCLVAKINLSQTDAVW